MSCNSLGLALAQKGLGGWSVVVMRGLESCSRMYSMYGVKLGATPYTLALFQMKSDWWEIIQRQS